MNKILSMITIAASAAMLTGCDEYDDLYPAEYSSVVRLEKDGEQNALVSPKTGGRYDIKLLRGGNNVAEATKTEMRVMTDEEWSTYATNYGMTSYNRIPQGSFTLGEGDAKDACTVDFAGNEAMKMLAVNFDGAKIAAYEEQLAAKLGEDDDDPIICLPLTIGSLSTGSAHESKTKLVIKISMTGVGGIETVDALLKFAKAVNKGKSIAKWTNEAGEVVLLNDMDLSGVESWEPIGSVDNANYSTANGFAAVRPFRGVFNGNGHCIKGLKVKDYDVTGKPVFALFGAIDNATIKDLTVGDKDGGDIWSFTGVAPDKSTYAVLVGYASKSTVTNCHNYVNIQFNADNLQNQTVMLGAIAGTVTESTIGGKTAAEGCTNHGYSHVGKLTNTACGQTCLLQGGVIGCVTKHESNYVGYCINYGHISMSTCRTGGVIGNLVRGTVYRCDNHGTVEDDRLGIYDAVNDNTKCNYKRMGGIVAGTDDCRAFPNNKIVECTNYGLVLCHTSCRTGGIVGHNNYALDGCSNQGIILGNLYKDSHGPGWLCGYCGASTDTWINAKNCVRGGKLGDYSVYKDNPEAAPATTNENAFCYLSRNYNPSLNK